jgi:hypothetical protein
LRSVMAEGVLFINRVRFNSRKVKEYENSLNESVYGVRRLA